MVEYIVYFKLYIKINTETEIVIIIYYNILYILNCILE